MRGGELREALAQGRRVYGVTLEGYGQPQWPAHFARLGLDFVFLDGEHAPLGPAEVSHAAQAYAARGIAPLYRIPEPSPVWATRALDWGAHGIIAPYVERVDQVKELVGAVRYRPLKGAALAALLDEGRFPSDDTQAYLELFNKDTLLVIMIESPAGVANLPDLLAVGGVDAVLVGPHDLSVAAGVPQVYDSPTFQAQVQQVVDTCLAQGVAVGAVSIFPDPEAALRWLQLGCSMVVYSSDTMFVLDGVAQGLAAMLRFADRVADGEEPRVAAPVPGGDLDALGGADDAA
jgi:2-keto-3-deoxy-L-rhamnonate aldolase RhmA